MAIVHNDSKEYPGLSQDVARLVTEVWIELLALGIEPPLARSIGYLDMLARIPGLLEEAGVGASFAAQLTAPDSDPGPTTVHALEGIKQVLAESPFPQLEWRSMLQIFTPEELGVLVGVSHSSVLRYARGERQTPDMYADRLHLIARVVALLKGAYNQIGIRRWFHRRRSVLDGQAPADLLVGDWTSDDSGPQAVYLLARSLLFAPAT